MENNAPMPCKANGSPLTEAEAKAYRQLIYNNERRAWRQMLEHDGIKPAPDGGEPLFVVFSPDNPMRVTHDRISRQLQGVNRLISMMGW